MLADYVEKIYPIEYESKILQIHLCLFHRFTSETDITISEIDINKVLEFFLLTTYLLCLVNVFFNRQSAYLCVKTAPFLADLLLYSYETDFMQGLLTTKS
jgi:hypothetical protein